MAISNATILTALPGVMSIGPVGSNNQPIVHHLTFSGTPHYKPNTGDTLVLSVPGTTKGQLALDNQSIRIQWPQPISPREYLFSITLTFQDYFNGERPSYSDALHALIRQFEVSVLRIDDPQHECVYVTMRDWKVTETDTSLTAETYLSAIYKRLTDTVITSLPNAEA
jgi:hypothetical protein